MKRLLLLGGGHAHLFVLEAFIRHPLRDIELTLVTPANVAPYSGMMPAVIAGRYRYRQGCVNLDPLCRQSGCMLYQTRAVAVDPVQRQVQCEDGMLVDYDLLSIDIGSTSAPRGVAGAQEYAFPLRPIEGFIDGWDAFRESRPKGHQSRLTVVGGGAAGFEVALAMRYRFAHVAGASGVAATVVQLVSDMPGVLPGFPAGVRRRAEQALRSRGVASFTGNPVVRVEQDCVILGDGHRLASDFTVWATGAAAPDWPRASGLATDERGFILVDRTLRSLSHDEIFAAGDIAAISGRPTPRAGVYAVRAGPPLARNLRAALRGEPLQTYSPQRRALALLSAGERYAIGSWGPFSWEGPWVSDWKDRIDRGFVSRFGAA